MAALDGDEKAEVLELLGEAGVDTERVIAAGKASFHLVPDAILSTQLIPGFAVLTETALHFVSAQSGFALEVHPDRRAYFHGDSEVGYLVVTHRASPTVHILQMTTGLALGYATKVNAAHAFTQDRLDTTYTPGAKANQAKHRVDQMLVEDEFRLGFEIGRLRSRFRKERVVVALTDRRIVVLTMRSEVLHEIRLVDIESMTMRRTSRGAALLGFHGVESITVRVRDRFAERIEQEWRMKNSPFAQWRILSGIEPLNV